MYKTPTNSNRCAATLTSLPDSLAHRASVRAALGADPAWTGEYLCQAGPLLQAQDNALLEPLNAALGAVTPVDQGTVIVLPQ